MIYGYFIRGAKHAALAQTSIQSVKRADPLAEVVVVTDEERPKWSLPSLTLKIASGNRLMVANINAQIEVLDGANGADVLFLDTDTLLLRRLPSTWADITVTWRDHVLVKDEEKIEGIARQMPYNYGVIGVRDTQATLEALLWMRERVANMSPQNQDWYGNQLALTQLAGPRPESGEETIARSIPWALTRSGRKVVIRKLPCEYYNYTPQSPGENLASRSVLHFKGGARALMRGYAESLGLEWFGDERAAA